MLIKAAISRAGSECPVIEEVELDELRPDEMRVRMAATGICHTDISCHHGHGVPVAMPIVLGHEGAGVVEQAGANVSDLAVGDHVVMSGASCGNCPSCFVGRPTYCRLTIRLTFGAVRTDGSRTLSAPGRPHDVLASPFFGQSSFATHVAVAARSAVKVDRDMPFHLAAPLGCGLITGAGAVNEAMQLHPGDSLVVFGGGAVGLAAVMAAKIASASRIALVEPVAQRRELAEQLGAIAIAPGEGVGNLLRELCPDGFSFSFNTTRSPQIFTDALTCLANEGKAVFVSPPSGDWQPDMLRLLSGGRRLQGVLGGSANPQTFIPQMVAWWKQGRFPIEQLVATFPFPAIGEAWAAARSSSVIKAVVEFA